MTLAMLCANVTSSTVLSIDHVSLLHKKSNQLCFTSWLLSYRTAAMFSNVVMDTSIAEYMSTGLQSSGCGVWILTQCTVGGASSHSYSLGV